MAEELISPRMKDKNTSPSAYGGKPNTLISPALRWVFLFGMLYSLQSCYNETFITDGSAALTFSTDTLSFDTVLTEVGTVTRFFKVFNPHDQSIRIEDIKLTGPHAEFFSLNVDGTQGDPIKGTEIGPGDSIYVFTEATIDPDQPLSVSPFIIEAAVSFTTNGNQQEVQLVAWGQNANYIPGPHSPSLVAYLSCDFGEEVFDDPKPYVLYGVLVIDSCTLVLPPGTRLYIHGGIANNENGIYKAGFISARPDGKIRVSGSANQPVIIQDDRIESDYEGDWTGIYLGPTSGPHQFSHLQLSNADVGMIADSASTVTIDHSTISFTNGPGLFARHANVNVTNSLFYENSTQAIALTYGGTYELSYCTMSNYGNNAEALLMNNYYCSDPLCSEGVKLFDLHAQVNNCIMVGNSTDEIWMADASTTGEVVFDVQLNNNIVIVDDLLDEMNYPDFFENYCHACIEYQFGDLLFEELNAYDFHLDSISIARMKATPLPAITDDLELNPRDPVAPDIGCYEKQD